MRIFAVRRRRQGVGRDKNDISRGCRSKISYLGRDGSASGDSMDVAAADRRRAWRRRRLVSGVSGKAAKAGGDGGGRGKWRVVSGRRQTRRSDSLASFVAEQQTPSVFIAGYLPNARRAAEDVARQNDLEGMAGVRWHRLWFESDNKATINDMRGVNSSRGGELRSARNRRREDICATSSRRTRAGGRHQTRLSLGRRRRQNSKRKISGGQRAGGGGSGGGRNA